MTPTAKEQEIAEIVRQVVREHGLCLTSDFAPLEEKVPDLFAVGNAVWEAALEHAADFCKAHVCSTACPSEQCKMANDLAAALRREAHTNERRNDVK